MGGGAATPPSRSSVLVSPLTSRASVPSRTLRSSWPTKHDHVLRSCPPGLVWKQPPLFSLFLSFPFLSFSFLMLWSLHHTYIIHLAQHCLSIKKKEVLKENDVYVLGLASLGRREGGGRGRVSPPLTIFLFFLSFFWNPNEI